MKYLKVGTARGCWEVGCGDDIFRLEGVGALKPDE